MTRLLLPLLAVGLTACEMTIPVDLPPHERVLVVRAAATADCEWSVGVSHSVGALERGTPDGVDDAVVELRRDGEVVGAFASRSAEVPCLGDVEWRGPDDGYSGLYRWVGGPLEPGVEYEIHASAPGYAPVVGRQTVPTAVSAEVASVEVTPERMRIAFSIDDPEGADHYRVRLAERTEYWEGVQHVWLRIETSDPVLTPPTTYDEGFGGVYEHLVFDDALFDGRRDTFRLELDRQVGPEQGSRFVLAVERITPDLYRYYTSERAVELDGDLPFAEPVRVHSNIEDGYGIFGATAAQVLPFTVDAGE